MSQLILGRLTRFVGSAGGDLAGTLPAPTLASAIPTSVSWTGAHAFSQPLSLGGFGQVGAFFGLYFGLWGNDAASSSASGRSTAIASGAGWNSDGSAAGTASGDIVLHVQDGGQGTATLAAGNGGDLVLEGGKAGSANGGPGADGGDASLDAGQGSGAGIGGEVRIGASRARRIALGRNGATIGLVLGSDAQGDLFYRGSSGDLSRLAPGTSGQVLQTGGAGANPSWITLPTYSAGGGLSLTGTTFAASFGTGSGTVCQGNDSRLSDSRAPTGSAGGDLGGSYPNPTVAKITLGSDAQGDTYYRNASGSLSRLAPGTAGQSLVTSGSSANPAWRDRYTSTTLSGLPSLTSALTSADKGLVVLVTDDENGALYVWDGSALGRYPRAPRWSYGTESWADGTWGDWTKVAGASASSAIVSSQLKLTINASSIQNSSNAPGARWTPGGYEIGWEIIARLVAVTGTPPGSGAGNWVTGVSFDNATGGGYIDFKASNQVEWGVYGGMSGATTATASATFTSGNNWIRARYYDGRATVWYASQSSLPSLNQWILANRDLCTFGNGSASRTPTRVSLYMETWATSTTAVTATWDQVTIRAIT